MVELIKVGAIGFLSSKAMKVFSKKDLSDIILGVTVLYLAVHIVIGLDGFITGISEWAENTFGWLF